MKPNVQSNFDGVSLSPKPWTFNLKPYNPEPKPFASYGPGGGSRQRSKCTSIFTPYEGYYSEGFGLGFRGSTHHNGKSSGKEHGT